MEIVVKDYANWLDLLKQKIYTARLKASLAVNAQLLEVYWELGAEIVNKQNETDWD